MELSWQELLYPLGLISSLFFTLRVLYQWTLSEMTRSSTSPRGFWILSIGGNASHLIHSLLQMQLPIALIQACHLVIAHRNINLLKKLKYRHSFKRVLFHFIIALAATFGAFLALCSLTGHFEWMRSPTFPLVGLKAQDPSWVIQAIGILGIVLYASRFWIQWIAIEKSGKSHFSRSFWLVSLVGALLSSAYFIFILDWVNILGTVFTLIPYARNLVFLKKKVYE
jgi:lipid-A-disaccharide synthase